MRKYLNKPTSKNLNTWNNLLANHTPKTKTYCNIYKQIKRLEHKYKEIFSNKTTCLKHKYL